MEAFTLLSMLQNFSADRDSSGVKRRKTKEGEIKVAPMEHLPNLVCTLKIML